MSKLLRPADVRPAYKKRELENSKSMNARDGRHNLEIHLKEYLFYRRAVLIITGYGDRHRNFPNSYLNAGSGGQPIVLYSLPYSKYAWIHCTLPFLILNIWKSGQTLLKSTYATTMPVSVSTRNRRGG